MRIKRWDFAVEEHVDQKGETKFYNLRLGSRDNMVVIDKFSMELLCVWFGEIGEAIRHRTTDEFPGPISLPELKGSVGAKRD